MAILKSNFNYQFAIESGIIDFDSVSKQIMNAQVSKVETLHPYAITPPKESGGRWQTFWKDKNGQRHNIRAQTREKLFEKLVPLYFSDLHIDNLTFENLFCEWVEYKSNIANSPNTITRHKQHYKRYFQNLSISQKKIKLIDELELESICNNIVRENNMSRKEWTNVKTILIGMYSYAVRKGYLSINPLDKVEIHVKYRQVVKKPSSTQTFNSDELSDLNAYLDEKYLQTNDSIYMAVKINFFLGLRVGELVALQWSDWDDRHMHIVREEVRNQSTGQLQVVEHTKTNHDRYVIVVKKAEEILSKLNHDSEFIFVRDGMRITARQVNYVLEKYAEHTGNVVKSSHKIRKTYASNLSTHGVPLDCIREQLGHSDLSTTLSYIYNPLSEKQTYDIIDSAL